MESTSLYASIRAFLAAGLVDELMRHRLPVLVGEGTRFGGHGPSDIALEPMEIEAFEDGVVRSRYRVGSNPSTLSD